jgi:hypothetical protein
VTAATRAENVLDCPHCRQKTGHAFVAEKGEYNEIYEVLCVGCSVQYEIPRKAWLNARVFEDTRSSRAYLTKFPYVEPHTGEVVNSPEDVVRVTKAYGLHAAEHGKNERYDDEFSHQLRARERDRKDKLRAAGREVREILKAAKERQRLGYRD